MSEELNKMVADVVASSTKHTADEMDDYILKFFGDEATFAEFAHLYVLEVIHPSEFETLYDNDFSGEYKVRMTTKYRLRRKTKEELASSVATTSQELHGL